MLDDGRFRQAIERVKALRAEVGPDIELMLDLSGGLCDDQLMRFLDECRDLDIRGSVGISAIIPAKGKRSCLD